MDAARIPVFSFKRTACFLIAALAALRPLPAAPAAQLQVNGASTTQVTFTSNVFSSPVSVTSIGAQTAYTVSAMYGAGASGWVNWSSANNLTTPDTLQVYVQSTAGLVNGTTYTATLTLSPVAAGTSATISVSFTPGSTSTGTLTAAPNPLALSALVNGSTSGSVTVTNGTASTVTLTSASFAGSFIPTSITGTPATLAPNGGTASITIFASAVGLQSTTYSGTLTIVSSQGNLNVTVNFTVGSGVSTITASPNSLTFTSATAAAQFVTVSSSSGALTFTATANQSWFAVNGQTQAGGLPFGSTLSVSLTSAALALSTGSYTGNILLQGSDGSTLNVPVTLYVNGGNISGTTASPSPLAFSAAAGGQPAAQNLFVSSTSGSVNVTASVSTSSGGSWLFISSLNTTVAVPNTYIVSVTTGGLPAGAYDGEITLVFSGSGGITGTENVGVSLVVTSGTTTSSQIVAPSSIVFAYQTGTSGGAAAEQLTLLSQAIQVGAAAGSSFTATASTTSGGAWLSLNSSGTLSVSGTSPGTFQAIANPTSPTPLSAGTYSGTVTVSSSAGTTVIGVSLFVTASPVLQANPPYLLLSSGGILSQGVQLLASDESTALNIGTITPSASWITVGSPSQTTTPASITITANPAGLPTGLNYGYVTVNSSNAANATPLQIPVLVTASGGGAGS